MYNRKELERVQAIPHSSLAKSAADTTIKKAANIYGTKSHFVGSPNKTPQTIFGMQTSQDPIGSVTAAAADELKLKSKSPLKNAGPSAPGTLKNPFLHHVSQKKHHNTMPNYIPPQKRHLLREYLKRSSIRFFNEVSEKEKMSTTLDAARAGLTLDKIPETATKENGKFLLLHTHNKQAQEINLFGGEDARKESLIRVERSSLPPHLRREFDALTKVTEEIKIRDRKQKYDLTSEKNEQVKQGLYKSIQKEFEAERGLPAPNLKGKINFLKHNFKLGYSDSGNNYDLEAGDSFQEQLTNSDIANLKDFEGMVGTSLDSPLRTRSISPYKESFLRSPTLLGGKIQTDNSFYSEALTPRPFMATKTKMKNKKNESFALSETGHSKRITGPLTSQHRDFFVPHSVSPIKVPNMTFQSTIGKNFNQVASPYEKKQKQSEIDGRGGRGGSPRQLREATSPMKHRRSKTDLIQRPESGNSYFSEMKSNRLWSKYEKIDRSSMVYSAMAGSRSPDYASIKADHTAQHIRLGASYEISPKDKAYQQPLSHAYLSGEKQPKELQRAQKQKRKGILDFMSRRYVPLSGSRIGPLSSIHTSEREQEDIKKILSGKKKAAEEKEKGEMRHMEGKEIGLKVMGTNVPISQVEWKQGTPSMGVTSSFYQEKRNEDLGIHKTTNKYFRASEMAHYHRLGMQKDETKESEKMKSFRQEGSPTISEQEFTRRANRDFIEKQHFLWNRSFDALSDTSAKDFKSVSRKYDMYDSLGSARGRKSLSRSESLTDALAAIDNIPTAGNQQTARAILIENASTSRPVTSIEKRSETRPDPLRTNFVLGSHGTVPPLDLKIREKGASTVSCSTPLSGRQQTASGRNNGTLSQIREENQRNLKQISKNGWESHMAFGSNQDQKKGLGRSVYGKFFVWKQPVPET